MRLTWAADEAPGNPRAVSRAASPRGGSSVGHEGCRSGQDLVGSQLRPKPSRRGGVGRRPGDPH
eukprot:187743-Prorocentrum_lima.AAC.1